MNGIKKLEWTLFTIYLEEEFKMTEMGKVDGLEVTRTLMALEERTDLGFDVEVEVEINQFNHAKGYINFMNAGWDYEYKGEVIFLTLNDAETHFDHVLGMDGAEIGAQENDVQVTMEDITEIGTVVNIK